MRNISVDKLAEKSGLSMQRCAELEGGGDPTITEVVAIARGLQIAPRDLIVAPDAAASDQTRLRCNFNYSNELLAVSEYGYIFERMRILAQHSILISGAPKFSNLPKRRDAAEALATIVRRQFLAVEDAQPLLNLDCILYDTLGVGLIVGSFRSIDGLSFRNEGKALVFLSLRNNMRMLFTLAHELAHLLSDLTGEVSEVWLDQDVLRATRSNTKEERFANEFAAALLIPRIGVVHEIRDYRTENPGAPESLTAPEILRIARKFGVSFYVAGRRLESLELLPKGGAAKLNEYIKQKFGSPEKYATHLGLGSRPDKSWLLVPNKMINDMKPYIERGLCSSEEAAYALGLRVEALLGEHAGRYHH
ncbi:ImmA/IrrE family metallo-endopeptidase [Antarcticirhabdus aurantiaca]|uniref:XRE family transcriptional regulator n=1 Tax=Antarcticirhabdus aurantiaca TaxID=2606717 RepID=A0ACD4NT94_9HYPH|nr:XRE family transcriptional regulator [Antarcticirhabdus aurantiaca]WAJ30096.1 XRE family transcriptional regulator [Jeongeuplla avenae]